MCLLRARSPSLCYTTGVKSVAELAAKAVKAFGGVLPRQAEARFAVGALPLPVGVMVAAAMGKGKVLLVTASPAEAERAAADAAVLFPKWPQFLIPPADDEASLTTGERQAQVQALMAKRGGALVCLSIHALLQPIAEPKALAAVSRRLSVGEEVPFEGFLAALVKLGYARAEAPVVSEPLSFAVRGGIVDVWPAGAERPVRVEFFGDEVERLRQFDPLTQCSVGTVAELELPPAPGAKVKMTTLLARLADAAVVVADAPAVDSALAQLQPIEAGVENPVAFRALLARQRGQVCWSGEPVEPELPRVAIVAEPVAGICAEGEALAHHPEAHARLRRTLLTAFDERARGREAVLLCAASAAVQTLLTQALPPDTPIRVVGEALSEGFSLARPAVSVLTQNDLYPTQRSYRAVRRAAVSGQRLEYAFDVEPGELVVHVEHGIGRFLGLEEIAVGNQRREVFALEYAGGAKLYVPTTHAHLLSRYIGPEKGKVKLHALDGKRWQSEKEAAKRGIEDLAVRLLETQARRRALPGFAFDLSSPWIAEFEALFPWQETPDQARVIAEVKQDMASPTAMDRLLCGDAGYGKTEVAMRAAFIAVCNHKQVALLAPTTVLAEQHYATFCERMAPFPVRIEVLSRFRTAAQRTATRRAAAQGQIDILIGTHALLTENVPFKDLGLLVVDEEQRFGVAHKEQLKRLRALVDVLTMSATPIPRTLYLSLTGARDLSLLQTPPQNRVAVETVIQRDDDGLVAAAIRKELARGGQVFFLHNRVHTIGRLFARLQLLVPEARILVAHGQMAAEELAATMRTFAAGQADLLLCTSIIESGIDIPRANTILIDRADRFGLAELYQLRGRVGRSATRGFAYLLLPGDGLVDSDARKRLQALKRHSGLGAGYAIALRDLEIRGSGNLLGAAQSGHIAAIGFGLYCQLLRRTVARLKGEAVPTLVDVELALEPLDTSPGASGPNAAALPYDYIEDEAQRMNVYRRCAEAVTEREVKALQAELADRFGPLPPAAQRALRLTRLRILAAEAGLCKLEVAAGTLTAYDRRTRAPRRGLSASPLPPRALTSPELLLSHLEKRLSALLSPRP